MAEKAKKDVSIADADVRNDGLPMEMSDWSTQEVKEYREKIRFMFETGVLPKRFLDLKSDPDNPKAPCDRISEKSLTQAIAQIAYGRTLNLSPKMALSKTMLVNGEMTIWGDALAAVVYMSGLMEYKNEYYDEVAQAAVCEVKRKDMSFPERRQFSIEDAKIAGLWGQNVWAKYPKRMLAARARTYALRDVFPEVLAGMLTTEEAYEIQQQDSTRAYSEVIATPVIKKSVEVVAQDVTPVLEYMPAETFSDMINNSTTLEELVEVFAKHKSEINPVESTHIVQLFKNKRVELEQKANQESVQS